MIYNIFEFAPFPVWIKNTDGNIIYINKNFEDKFNIKVEYFYNNDLENLEIIKYIKSIKNEFVDIKNIHNKLYKHIAYYDQSKNNQLIGFFIDISNENDKELENQRNILKTIIDNVPELVFYKDNKGIYKGINRYCEQFYKNLGVENVIGKKDDELPLNKEFTNRCVEHDELVINTKKTLTIDEKVPTDNGKSNIVETIKTPVINEDGEVWGIVGVVRDITEKRKYEEKLKKLSYTDSLTGLYNRAYFDDKLEEMIENKEFPIGMIMGDVNGLKIINDTIGHIEGDLLLRTISKKLKQVFDDKGCIFRWGGDEFVILLPNTSGKECEYLTKEMSIMCNEYKNDKFNLSISMGYSVLNNENDKIDKVIAEAEEMSYKYKILDSKSFRNSTLDKLMKTLQYKKIETKEHTERVAKYATLLGEYLNLDKSTIEELNLVGNLHDIGKIGISEDILFKEDRLTKDEEEIMKTHCEKGYRLTMLFPEFSHISRSILTHHERWDGQGYPLGLKGEEIPLVSRIISVVDSYDCMVNYNFGKNKKTKEEALMYLKKYAGSKFDINIVKAFHNLVINKGIEYK